MSWFSSVSIDEQVEKATSESLPTGEQDLGLNLEICDMIRSKTVPPKDAMRSLKRRLLHKNPNVKIATLHLIDICIKNGGSHFLQEIASREFMDSAMLVLKPPSGVINREVQDVLLLYIQNWANAFDGQIQLNYVNKIYNQLRSEGFQFPESTKLGSSFIDTSAPPEWVDSDTCMKSGTPFSFVNRKHHCRNCGGVYIQKHCQNYIPLPHFGINEPVRVCDDCYGKLESKKRTSNNKERDRRESNSSSIKYQGTPSLASNSQPHIEEEDEDLKRALALSLEDSNRNKQPQPAQPAPAPVQATGGPSGGDQDAEEDDEDMKAAIAASLRDMEHQKKDVPQPQDSQNGNNNLYSHPTQAQTAPDLYQGPQEQAVNHNNLVQQQTEAEAPLADEFSPLEEEILHRYIQLVEGLQHLPHGAILKDTKLQQLNDSVSALRPKLARTLGSTIDKYDRLVDMHGKLTTVVRYYDQILEERLQRSHISPVSPQHSGYYYASPHQQQQQQYGQIQAQAPPVNASTHPYPSAVPSAPPAPSDSYYPSAASAPPVHGNAPHVESQPHPQHKQAEQKPAQDEILIEL